MTGTAKIGKQCFPIFFLFRRKVYHERLVADVGQKLFQHILRVKLQR